MNLHRYNIERIIKRGFVQKSKRGEILKTHVELSGVYSYWKNLIHQMICGFYFEKRAPYLDSLHAKLIKISKGTEYEFHYKCTSPYHLKQKHGFRYKKCDKGSVIMESMKITACSYKYFADCTR